jgi:DNA helicase II / ATP-dependent DNA helicase PcrA
MNAGDRWTRARAMAQQVRAEVELDAPDPGVTGLTLVARLLDRRDFDVVFAPSTDSLLGGAWASLYPDTQIAACDRDLAPTRQAFCLAHELGHLVLHTISAGSDSHRSHARDTDWTDGCASAVGEIDGQAGDALLNGQSLPSEIYNPRQQRELEANAFALELLAPRAQLRQLFVEQGLTAVEIANRLGLSLSATSNALAGLLSSAQPGSSELETIDPQTHDGEIAREDGLDPSQRRAATMRGATLVTAGPGSGKTSTLIGRVAHLLNDTAIDPRSILVLTYSNRAAASLRARISEQGGQAAYGVTISTVHGFAHDVLRRFGALVGLPPAFRVLDASLAALVLRRHLADLSAFLGPLGESISLDRPLSPLLGLLNAVSRAKDDLLTAEDVAARLNARTEADDGLSLLAGFYTWYASLCQKRGLVDYGDLLLLACTLLRENAHIRAELATTFQWLLVDEYQDMNLACAEFLNLLAPTSGLWAVGDPLQAIYRWRGANPGALDHTAKGLSNDDSPAMLDLDINYRSCAPIVRLCGSVGAAMNGMPIDAGRARWSAARGEIEARTAPIIVAVADDAETEIAGIALEIEREVANGRAFADHAVLCATNAQADALARGLETCNIPVCRTVAAHDDPAVRGALCVLALAAGEPDALIGLGDDSASERSDGRSIGLSATSARYLADLARQLGVLAALSAAHDSLSIDQRDAAWRLADFIEGLQHLNRAARPESSYAWTAMARFLFDAPYRAAAWVVNRPRSCRALYALLVAARAYDGQSPDLRESSFAAHVRLLLAAGIGISSDGLDVGEQGVRVLTVHAAKGLEFPVVFIPNFVDGRFPARGRGGRRGSHTVSQDDEDGSRELDDRSMLFVALSRARDRLVLSHAKTYGARESRPSRLAGLLDEAFRLEPPSRVDWTATRASPGDARLDPTTPESNAAITIAVTDTLVTARPQVDNYALETYIACPRRFYYRYRIGLGDAPSDSFAHFHATLRRTIARIAGSETTISEQSAIAALDMEWAENHDRHPHEDLFYQRARRAVLGYTGRLEEHNRPAGESQDGLSLAVDLEHGTVVVRIDRVDLPQGGEPVAIRYRSGRQADDHRRDVRAALYQAALHAAYGSGVVHQEYLLSGATDSGRARPDTMRRRLDDCDAALAGIAAEKFAPSRGEHCAECPFWLVCPNG